MSAPISDDSLKNYIESIADAKAAAIFQRLLTDIEALVEKTNTLESDLSQANEEISNLDIRITDLGG